MTAKHSQVLADIHFRRREAVSIFIGSYLRER
jgi:hypothetical protein